MARYKHPCRYCDKLVPSDSNVCPICGGRNPIGPLRCPKCRNPIEKGWINCNNCGLPLKTICSKCGNETFFGDHCDVCKAPITIICPNPKCLTEQPPLGERCIKCGKPLK
jgi:hypothetical protein